MEGAPVLLLQLQSLGALPCVTNGPHPSVELPRNIFNQGLIILDFDVFAQLIREAKFARQLVQDRLVRQ